MANESPAFQFYARDFLADTIHMTAEEVGAYWLILSAAWLGDRPGYVPNDHKLLASMGRLRGGAWKRCSKAILGALKTSDDGAWLYSKRMVAEREKQIENRKSKSEAGKAGADARWQPHGSAMALPSVCHPPANALALPPHDFGNGKPIANDGSASASSSASADLSTHTREAGLWPIWKAAGLPIMVDGLEMRRLDAMLVAGNCDKLAFCKAFKKLTDGWRAGGASQAGASPTLMMQHMDKVELVANGELDPFAKAKQKQASEPTRPAMKTPEQVIADRKKFSGGGE